MALFILTPGIQPLGNFDCLDTDMSSIIGGEIVTLDKTSATNTSTEAAAADVLDGYISRPGEGGSPTAYRTVARLATTATETYKFFGLADEGIANYGTLFGSLIGGTCGTGAASVIGPSSMSGSGKITIWEKPGLYAVTLTALAADVVPTATGNLYDTPLPGTILYRGATSAKMCRLNTSGDKIALFVELSNSGGMSQTPKHLITGLASSFDRIVIQYLGATHNV